MKPVDMLNLVIRPTLLWMGGKYWSRQAEVMLLAIALQESDLEHRVQIKGPARGYWQFEKGGGVKGVVNHWATKDTIREICIAFDYEPTIESIYAAIPDNDLLACVMARLLLYTHPKPLPPLGNADAAWKYYEQDLWKPGKPRPADWYDNYRTALATT